MFKLGLCISVYTKKSSFLVSSYQVYISYLADCEIWNGFQLKCFFSVLCCLPGAGWEYSGLLGHALFWNFFVCFLWQILFQLIMFQPFIFPGLLKYLFIQKNIWALTMRLAFSLVYVDERLLFAATLWVSIVSIQRL